MAYCPYYSKDCPEDSSCAAWRTYGCSASYMPGISAEYSGVSPSIDVFILGIYSSNAKAAGDILIIFSRKSDGVIGTSDDLSEFIIQ